MRISSCIYVAANGIVLSFFVAEYYSIVYMYNIFLIHSSVNGHLGYVHVWAIVYSAATAKTWKQPKCPLTEEWKPEEQVLKQALRRHSRWCHRGSLMASS